MRATEYPKLSSAAAEFGWKYGSRVGLEIVCALTLLES